MIRSTLIFLFFILTTAVSPMSAAAAPIRLTDMAGRSLELTAPAQRLVSTFKPATLCLVSLGLAKTLVGVDNPSRRDKLQTRVYPPISQIPGVGQKAAGVNFETIVSLKPDLVLLYAQMDGPIMAKRLKRLGIESMIILPETFDTIKQSLDLMARACGVGFRAKKVKTAMDGILDTITQTLPRDIHHQRAYFASTLGIFNTTTGNLIQDEIMTRAGLENVSASLKGYFQDISPEQLIRWNPDIIIASQHLPQSQVKFLSNRALAQISAIQTHQIFRCPSNLAPWDFPSPLSVLASLWMAQRAYPSHFKDLDMVKISDDFHHTLFGKTLTQLDGNLKDRLLP